MTPFNFARIAKLVALLGFFLPWVLVSCSTTPVAKATGVQLAMGKMTSLISQGPAQPSHPAWWVVAAIVLVVAGLALSFLRLAQVQRARIMVATSLAAIACAWLSLSSIDASARQQSSTDPQAAQMAAAIHVEPQGGYWLTIWALVAAAGLSGLVALGRDQALAGLLAQAGAAASAASKSARSADAPKDDTPNDGPPST
jgi:hypothetical protein